MKRRRVNPAWTINDDKSVYNFEKTFMGYAQLEPNGEYSLRKTRPKTFNDLLTAIAR